MTAASLLVERPTFPPLLTGRPLATGLDPFDTARAAAMTDETDGGTIFFAEDDAAFRAAVVLLPETPLAEAMGVALAVELGLSDAIGALAPPEVAVQFDWPDRIKVNGAVAGRMRLAASTNDPDATPDWLVVGLDLAVAALEGDPGERPGETSLHEEGCVDITAPALIESWSRHMLVWIHRFVGEGLAPVLAEWRGKCDFMGKDVTYPEAGTFVGLDDRGGMVLRGSDGTRTVPLTSFLGAR